MIEVVVFDFDGVLVDSNAVKRQAFFSIFEEQSERLRVTIERSILENIGSDRFTIIRSILTGTGTPSTDPSELDALVSAYADRYNDICEEHAATCREIGGASASLEALVAGHALYVNSATPEVPLRRIVARRGWGPRFRDVLGRPRDKVANLRRIFTASGATADAVLFVGDGGGDLAAARETGCHFLAVRNAFNDFDPMGVRFVDDLTNLPAVVRGWNC